MTDHAPDRLARLLALIAYLEENPGVPVARVAEHFGVREQQVLEDVNTLWVSGAPGYLHGDLIDFAADEYDHGVLTLTDDQSMSTPLRLDPAEAVALLVALQSLAAVIGENALVASTSVKLREAAGDAARLTEAVRIDGPEPAEHRGLLATAISADRRVRLRYLSAADEETERDVDPLTLLTDGQHWYLDAWCHRARAPRQFRLDRILSASALPVPRARHAGPAGHAGRRGPGAAGDQVALRLAGRARWVADQVPHTRVDDHDDGSFTLHLGVTDPRWLRRLCLELGPLLLGVGPGPVARDVAGSARAALEAYAAFERPDAAGEQRP
ncbi:WYL domain-containing protein [Pseudactinotalea sp. HY160]|uniref:helix-turn-helix transcriptional regulator n=1 Tax=Pseudactinotalea sp. HY160 TaxID=2654490 RepID=UPI00128B2200|nr:WYL domain-containing protein [Pseudactinotalea sp. HY160]MPV49312.1 WYL domain-containing protein [Pseudactinotalea sp. HY160]